MKYRFQNLIYYTLPDSISFILRKRLDYLSLVLVLLLFVLWSVV